MNKYILDYVKNNTKTVFRDLSVPQKKVMKHLVKRLFQSGDGILRRLGEGYEQLPKTIAEKFSRHLGKVDLLASVETFADRQLLKLLTEGSVIAYDLTDINKSFAKKIENLDKCFDGSRRERSKGFFAHGVGCGKFLWRLRVHDNTRKFLNQVRKEILHHLIGITAGLKVIFALDRGNDDKKLFEDLDDKKVRFIIRLKKNRVVILKETGEIKKVEELPEGRYDVLIAESNTEQRKKPKYREYELVIYKKKKSKKHPIRLLISKYLDPDKKFSNKKITNLYLQRWGVENSFKQIKTNMNLESIRVLSFKKFQNLVSLQHLCLLLNELLFHRIQQSLIVFSQNLSLTKIFCEYKKFLKRYTLTVNSYSFFKFFQKIFPDFYRHRKMPAALSQPSLFQFINQKPTTF
jgi:hypothetical protein